jgi:threonine/homoserine/homoserine lactone efflux protein
MLVYALFGLTYGFAAAVQPGPFTTYLISQALTSGWRRTLPAVFAPLLSDGPIALLALVVLTSLPAAFVQWLRLLGGLFVLYLAYGAWRSWRRYRVNEPLPVRSARENVLRATLVNVLNPAPYLGWSLVMGPLLLKGWHETPAHGIALVVAFYATMFSALAAIILIFHGARAAGRRVTRVLVGVSAVALAGFGLYQLWLGTAPWRGGGAQ